MSETTKTKSSRLVANVCFYGTHEIGFAYLAETEAEHGAAGFGTYTRDVMSGERRMPHESLTEALWHALDAIRAHGFQRGLVRVFAPGGELYADVSLSLHRGRAFGSMTWGDIVGWKSAVAS